METPHLAQSPHFDRPPGWWREAMLDAIRFWEPRRLLYNLVLMAVALVWLVASWPHFRPAFTLPALLRLTVLAVLANVCYCAAYLADVPLHGSALRRVRIHRRRLWVLGSLFAVVLENYWIADEIYPFVR